MIGGVPERDGLGVVLAEILDAAVNDVGMLCVGEGKELVHIAVERTGEPEAQAVDRAEAREALQGVLAQAQRAVRVGSAVDGRAGNQDEQLVNARLDEFEVAAVREENGSQKLVEQPLRLLAVLPADALQQAVLQIKGIVGRAAVQLERLNISRDLALNRVRTAVLQQAVFRRYVVEKAHGHKEQR